MLSFVFLSLCLQEVHLWFLYSLCSGWPFLLSKLCNWIQKQSSRLKFFCSFNPMQQYYCTMVHVQLFTSVGLPKKGEICTGESDGFLTVLMGCSGDWGMGHEGRRGGELAIGEQQKFCYQSLTEISLEKKKKKRLGKFKFPFRQVWKCSKYSHHHWFCVGWWKLHKLGLHGSKLPLTSMRHAVWGHHENMRIAAVKRSPGFPGKQEQKRVTFWSDEGEGELLQGSWRRSEGY